MKEILIVENSPVAQQRLKQELIALDYEITAIVDSGEEALRFVEENRPELIIIDLILAGELDGARAAQKLAKKTELPILYFTERPEECLDIETPADYLPKSFITEQLEKSLDYLFKASSQAEEIDFQSAKILMVDDAESNRQLIKLLLAEFPLEVSLANSGIRAVELAIEEQFDLILMDLNMPDIDGYQAFKRLRNHKLSQNKETPVVALTASITDAERKRVQESGFAGFISKLDVHKTLVRELKDYL